jgi:hypothetical protein
MITDTILWYVNIFNIVVAPVIAHENENHVNMIAYYEHTSILTTLICIVVTNLCKTNCQSIEVTGIMTVFIWINLW